MVTAAAACCPRCPAHPPQTHPPLLLLLPIHLQQLPISTPLKLPASLMKSLLLLLNLPRHPLLNLLRHPLDLRALSPPPLLPPLRLWLLLL